MDSLFKNGKGSTSTFRFEQVLRRQLTCRLLWSFMLLQPLLLSGPKNEPLALGPGAQDPKHCLQLSPEMTLAGGVGTSPATRPLRLVVWDTACPTSPQPFLSPHWTVGTTGKACPGTNVAQRWPVQPPLQVTLPWTRGKGMCHYQCRLPGTSAGQMTLPPGARGWPPA